MLQDPFEGSSLVLHVQSLVLDRESSLLPQRIEQLRERGSEEIRIRGEQDGEIHAFVSFVGERLEERVGRWSGDGAVGRVGDDGGEEEIGWEVR